MKKTKRPLSMILAFAMAAALLSGCGQSGGETTGSTTAGSTGQVTENKPEPVTFTVKNVAPGKDWVLNETPIGQIVFEKTGVNIKFEHSVGDEDQTIALIIASGDMPDVVLPRYKAAPFIDADAAIELTDLIETYAPNYKKALGTSWDRMVWSKEDKGRYFFTGPEQYPEQFGGRDWFFLQHAVVMDQGFPEIKTIEQYENAIRQYLQKYPEIDGKPTIGMTLNCDQWRWILSLTNPAMMVCGVESSGEIYVDPQTGKVTYRVTRPEEKEYFQWLNHMYNTGLLDKEAFTQTYDQFKAKVATGRVLALTDMAWEIQYESEAVLLQDGKPERTYGAYPVVMKEGLKNTTFSGGRAYEVPVAELVLTKSCKKPERFLQYINWCITDEAQILNNWGIEGVHYDIVDGKRAYRPEEMQKRKADEDYGMKTGTGFAPVGYGAGVKDPTGQYYTVSSKEDIVASYSEVEKQVLSAYGKTVWADFFAKPEEFPMRPWPGEGMIVNKLPTDSEELVIFQKLQDIVKKDVIRAIVAKPSEFDAQWDAFLADMEKAGCRKFEEACEKLMQEHLELWGLK